MSMSKARGDRNKGKRQRIKGERRIDLLLCVFAGLFLLSFSAKAQTTAVAESEQFLQSHDPMREPLLERKSGETAKRESAEKLFRSQLQAIHDLDKSTDPAAIGALIPYLGYTSYDSFTFASLHEGAHPKIADISETYPAFEAIISNPAAGDELQSYVLNSDHPVKYRLAAVHVLRYVDKDRFQTAAKKLKQEFTAGTPIMERLEAIINKDAPFIGIISIQTEMEK